jgi:F-type H+-transporting ATPase subunit b
VGEFQSFIGIDFWTALFTLLNFLAVFFVGKKFLWGPVIKIITDRQKEIDDMYTSAGEAQTEANAMRDEYQQKLSAAQQTSERLVKEATLRGQAKEEEIIQKANEEASAILSKAAADIAMEKKKAINDAKDEIAGLSLAIAGKVVERELTSADQQKLIDSFIDGLGDGV